MARRDRQIQQLVDNLVLLTGTYDESEQTLIDALATLPGFSDRLAGLQVIWRQEPKTVGRGHFGHRMVFGRDGSLFVTSGDRMRFDPAQIAFF